MRLDVNGKVSRYVLSYGTRVKKPANGIESVCTGVDDCRAARECRLSGPETLAQGAACCGELPKAGAYRGECDSIFSREYHIVRSLSVVGSALLIGIQALATRLEDLSLAVQCYHRRIPGY
jgi:hypothetical protein